MKQAIQSPLMFLQPRISFRHPASVAERNSATKEFPIANTCIIHLQLPILPNYNKFAEDETGDTQSAHVSIGMSSAMSLHKVKMLF